MEWFLESERRHRLWPDYLYVALSAEAEKTGIYVAELAGKTRKQVMMGNARTIYVDPGYLLFVRDGTLMAQPFDTGKLETIGGAVLFQPIRHLHRDLPSVLELHRAFG